MSQPESASQAVMAEYHCCNCGGTDVKKDAMACWSAAEHKWVLIDVFDDPIWCEDCDAEVDIELRPIQL